MTRRERWQRCDGRARCDATTLQVRRGGDDATREGRQCNATQATVSKRGDKHNNQPKTVGRWAMTTRQRCNARDGNEETGEARRRRCNDDGTTDKETHEGRRCDATRRDARDGMTRWVSTTRRKRRDAMTSRSIGSSLVIY